MNEINKEGEEKAPTLRSQLTKRVATSAILIAVGVFLSYLNPFAYFDIFGTKINPFAHIINGISGVLLGVAFSCLTAFGIAILRFSFGIGSIHAFHGGISGALVVGLVATFLKKKYPKYVNLATLTEPLGTVFIGGTIAQLIIPTNLFIYWGLFAASCIPGCIIGYVMLEILKKSGISWEDFYNYSI